MSEMWRICAHAPKIHLGRGLLELLLDSSDLVERRLRWLGVIKTAMLAGCPAWLDADTALGRAAGSTDAQLAELPRCRESSAFTPVEKLVLDLAVGMAATPAAVGDAAFAELRGHFSEAQVVELLSDIAMGTMRSRFNRAFLCRPAGFSAGAFCPLPER